MNRYSLLFLAIFATNCIYAQSVNHANQLFEEMNYTEAAKVYEDYIAKTGDEDISVLKRAGDSHYYLNENEGALKWYEKLYQIQGEAIEDRYLFRYIQSLRGVENYEESEKLTQDYLDRKNDSEQVENYLAQKKHLDSLNELGSAFNVKNLDINSKYSEFAPAFYGDKVVFSSSQASHNSNKLYVWNKQPYLNLFIAERTKEEGELVNQRQFIPEVASRYHDATVAFSNNLDTIYYTRNSKEKFQPFKEKDNVNNFQIIKGVIKDGGLEETESLPFNSEDYSVGHPTLSDDGDYLFFVSDMPGGYGETDIYVSEIASDGTMGEPQNLGTGINTEGREMFPYFKENTLYFSSDGHYGLGGLDVFSSKITEELEFSLPQNLGKPVNSSKDDFSFIITEDKSEGYMASNRAEGKGDDDIYYFTRECYQYITGTVKDSITGEVIEDASIVLYNKFKEEERQTTSDEDGVYIMAVKCDEISNLVASKENYTSDEREDVASGSEYLDTIKGIDFSLIPYEALIVDDGEEEKIKVDPIFFEFDKSEITPRAEKQLDSVLYVLEEFPDISIKIESHTDARGTDEYNLQLSQRRAEATKKYLLEQGVELHRIISIKGYGEIEIRNHCEDGVYCTEEEHEENRRSDFIIVH